MVAIKKLFLVRHAKSSWDFPEIDDIDRPLNNRGFRDARAMAAFLQTVKPDPELIISSPANRTYSTALIFSRVLRYPLKKIALNTELFDSSAREYLDVIRKLNDEHSCVMLFGHNFSISDLLQKLTEKGVNEMPTCAVAGLQFHVDKWASVKPGNGELFFYKTPKELLSDDIA